MIINLPRISFGGLQLGGYGVGKVNEPEIIKAAHKAIECGVGMFDTASIYGLGHSEELLGKILIGKRNKVMIMDRIGLSWEYDKGTFKKHINNSPWHIYRNVNESLLRLNTDCIDICLLHYPDLNAPIESTMNILFKLRKQGKIRWFGCSNIISSGADLIKKYFRLYGDLIIECGFNLIYRLAEQDILPFCNQYYIPVVAHSPLAEGLLTGKYTMESKFDINDRRNNPNDIYFGKRYLSDNIKVLDRVKEVATVYNCTPSQVALSWVLHNEAISMVSVGIKTVEQLDDNLNALELILLSNDILYLEGSHGKAKI